MVDSWARARILSSSRTIRRISLSPAFCSSLLAFLPELPASGDPLRLRELILQVLVQIRGQLRAREDDRPHGVRRDGREVIRKRDAPLDQSRDNGLVLLNQVSLPLLKLSALARLLRERPHLLQHTDDPPDFLLVRDAFFAHDSSPLIMPSLTSAPAA